MTLSVTPRTRTRRRRKIGASVRVVTPEPRRNVRATRRTMISLYAPRITLNPWHNAAEWRESRPKFFAWVILIVLVVTIYELFSASPFYVDSVNFAGNRFVSSGELSQAAALRGWSIFYLDPREVENTLLKLPEIKGAQVTFNLPNRVDIRIAERVPAFVWETRGVTYWVDAEAIAFKARTNVTGVLRMTDLDGAPVKIGQRVNLEAFNAAVSLRNAWPDGPTAFQWSKAHGLALVDQHNWLVYFGQSNQMQDKLTAFHAVTEQIVKENKQVTYVDLGNGLPYYREAKAPATSGN